MFKTLEDKRKMCALIDDVRATCPRDIRTDLTHNANNKKITQEIEAYSILSLTQNK